MVELIDPSVFKNLPQVTSTISFGPNGPTNDGLYSKIIFGDSLQANTFNFAYINLGTKIMNPELYLNISCSVLETKKVSFTGEPFSSFFISPFL